jgi:hypothetical protein
MSFTPTKVLQRYIDWPACAQSWFTMLQKVLHFSALEALANFVEHLVHYLARHLSNKRSGIFHAPQNA